MNISRGFATRVHSKCLTQPGTQLVLSMNFHTFYSYLCLNNLNIPEHVTTNNTFIQTTIWKPREIKSMLD